MIEVYRKLRDSLDSEWHFHTQCPRWPEANFIQTRFSVRMSVGVFVRSVKLSTPKCSAITQKHEDSIS